MSDESNVAIHLQYIRDTVKRIDENVEKQNGRLREAEADIRVLEARAEDSKREGAKSGGISGAIGGFVAGFLTQLTAMWMGK